MSSQLLEHLDKFEIEQLGLFGILEEMLEVFSEPIYNQLMVEIFEKEKFNDELLEKVFKNGNIINSKILDQVDSKFTKELSEKKFTDSDFVAKCIKNYNWKENNITKPSKIVSFIISQISFNGDPEDLSSRSVYENIKDSIHDYEKEKFYARIHEIIEESVASKATLPALLLEHLKTSPIENFELGSKEKQEIFASLCVLIKENSDIAQTGEILELIIPLGQKIEELSNQIISPEKYLEDAFVNYANRADANMLKNLIGILPSLDKYLKKEQVIVSIIDRYIALGSTDPEIIRFLLKNTSYSTEDVVISKFEEMIISREEPKFTSLLSTAKENDSDFNSNLIKKIGKICLQEAKDEDNPIRHSMYEHASELKLDSYDRRKIPEYAISLLEDEQPNIQDQGFALLRKFNSKNADRAEPAGISKALEIAKDLVENNSMRVVQYLTFILEYKDRLDFSQRRELISFFKEGLKPDHPENIMNNVMAFLKKSPTEITEELIDELIEFAEQTPHANAKKQCRQLLVSLKEKLRSRQEKKIKAIFGEDVLN